MFTGCRILIVTALLSLTVSALAQQMPVLSKICPVGTKEAQDLCKIFSRPAR